MTREDAKKLLPIIEAYANGEDIQIFRGGYWEEDEVYNFSGSLDHYRIKPKPREFWINKYKQGIVFLHETKEEAVKAGHGSNEYETIHLIEILD